MLLQQQHDASDPKMGQALDTRASFWCFVGLCFGDTSPSHSTIRRFCSDLARLELARNETEMLFKLTA